MASLIACLLILSNLLGSAFAQQSVLNDTAFYGQSPEVPAPIANGTGTWADAYAKARAAVAQLTLEEKVNLTGGVTAPNGCSGNIPGVDHIGFPGMCLTDAGNGVRATDFVNGWPSGIHVGARYGVQHMLRFWLTQTAGTKTWLINVLCILAASSEPKACTSHWDLSLGR